MLSPADSSVIPADLAEDTAQQNAITYRAGGSVTIRYSDGLVRGGNVKPALDRVAEVGGSHPEPGRLDCSIVIHTKNRCRVLADSLRRFSRSFDGQTVEIIVADSASEDDTLKMLAESFPHVKVIALPQDRGSSYARNMGIREARGEFILVADDDTSIELPELAELIEVMRATQDAGLLSCSKVSQGTERLLYTHHVPIPWNINILFFAMTETGIGEFLRWVFQRLNLGVIRPDQLPERVHIGYIGGAFLLARSEAVRRVGLWDENIFFYGEDFDWCYRFRLNGWKILYLPRHRAYSAHGVNARRDRRNSLIALQSRKYLFRKYMGPRYIPLYWILASAGLMPKLLYYLVQDLAGRSRRNFTLGQWAWGSLQSIFGNRRDGLLENMGADRTARSGRVSSRSLQ